MLFCLPIFAILSILSSVEGLTVNTARDGQEHELVTRQNQVQLADGSKEQFGKTSNGLSWQATGILYQGCSPTFSSSVAIADCYALQLSSDPTKNLDPGYPNSPRQRIEFLTSTSSPGTTHQYKWRYYLSSKTGTTTRFFHLMQLFSRDTGSPVITLDAVKGQLVIDDNIRDCSTTKCPSIPLSSITDKTTTHQVKIKFGDASTSGSFQYVIKDVANENVELLRYTVTGDLGGNAYIKFGTYRAAVSGMTPSLAAVGDFVVQS